jgi:flagellar basal body rod protein FlgC
MRIEVASFKTRELAIERIKEDQPGFSLQPVEEYDPEDPNANAEGYVWVISVSLHKDADNLYLCADGNIR